VTAGFPLPDTDWPGAAGFWAGAAVDELRVTKCEAPACGRYVWYPQDTCPVCGGPVGWARVSGRATLFSWAVVEQVLLPQFAGLVPYITGLAALDEDPSVRLCTRIVDADAGDLRIDMPLEVTFGELCFDGVDGAVRAPFFRPA
jgi:uncharacterized OB-fold protein